MGALRLKKQTRATCAFPATSPWGGDTTSPGSFSASAKQGEPLHDFMCGVIARIKGGRYGVFGT